MHVYYGLIWNPYASSSITIFLWNSITLSNIPYSAFCILSYHSGFPLIPTMTYLWYILGATFAMISDSSPSRNIITYLYVLMCRYKYGVPKIAIYWHSCVSTYAVMNTDSVVTVGEGESSLLISSHCFLLYAQLRTFMSPLLFSFRNISDPTTSTHYFC